MKKPNLKAFFTFLLFCFNAMVGNSQPKSVFYNGESEVDIVSDQITYLAAGDTVNTVIEASENFNSRKFLTNHKKILNLGIAKDNYWIRMLFVNATAENNNLILDLENPRLNEVDIFILKKGAIVSKYKVGDKFNFFDRKIIYNQFAIPILLKEKDSIEIFILLKHKGNTLQVPMKLHTQNSFYKKVESSYLIIGITAGIFMLTIFFSIFLFIKSKKRLFVFYAIYLLSILTWLISTEGYGFQFLWPNQPEWATRFGPGFSMFNLSTFIIVALEFTRPYDLTIWIRRLLYGIAGIIFLWGLQAFMPYINISNTALMSVFLKTSFTIYFIALVLMMVYMLYVSLRKNKLVFYYFFAVIVSIVFTLLVVARHSGLINIPISSGSFASIGVIFEIILMTLGIANQFNQYKKEKEDMLIQYLEQQESITQQIIDTQEQERKRISREMHDDIGAGLTQITLISESIKKKVGYASEKEISDIASTSRKLVHNMSEIIWSMNPENKTLGQLLSYLREELGKQLEYSGLHYTINFQETELEVLMSNVQLRNIMLATKEIVNNSIKHSNGKRISIKLLKKEHNLVGNIEDDGCGFDPQQKNNGNGLKNIKQRIEELDGKLSFQSNPGHGTKFEFIIPLSTTT